MNITKIKSFFLALFFSLVIVTIGCNSTKELETKMEEAAPKADKNLSNNLLWKIEGKELTKPSYLYGTIHIIGKEDFFLPDGTLGAIDNTDKMVFEIDMNEMSDISASMGLLSEIFMKDNKTLKDLLSDEDYTLVNKHFQKIGMPMMMLERMKPMFLTVFAGEGFDITGLQSGSMKSYEMEFFEMAQTSNKGVGGLETIEFQISLFDTIPYEAQAGMLVDAIKSSDSGSDQFQEMIDMYKAQDITSMISMISDESSDVEGFESLLVDERNKNWIPKMALLMETSPVFFAVGAGHLAGENGVINLLREEGYKVTPVNGNTTL